MSKSSPQLKYRINRINERINDRFMIMEIDYTIDDK